MTAIAAAWGADLPRAGALLDAMGPRASAWRSEWEDGSGVSLAIGHHPSRAGQESVVADGVSVIFDGRLDGDSEARPGLAVIAVYTRFGVGGFAQLSGEFAFVLWDERRARLVCARDALGSRPLVYSPGRRGFAVASEERGLGPVIGDEPLCDTRIAEFLAGMAPPIDKGMRASVRRVVPGTAVIVTAEDIEIQTFDQLAPPKPTTDAPDVQIARFGALLKTAVARRCARQAHVDCFLSGGLDSSSLALIAAAEASGSVRTLSLIDTDRPALSERPYIDAVVAEGGFDVRMHEIGAYDPFAGAQAALVRHAGPVVAPNLLMMRPLYEDAREGAVLLDGHGGDEVVSKGLGRLHDLARAGAWLTLYRELKGVADLYGERASTMLFVLFRAYGPGRHKLSALIRVFERLTGRTGSEDSPLNLLSPEFRQRSGIDAEMAERRRPRPPDGRQADHAVLLEPQQPYALEVLDREAQDAGVEVRCPFWDRRLIDYSMSLPASAKLKDGWTRLILRQAMTGLLPPKVLWRRDKHDFSVQLREGLRSSPVVRLEAIDSNRSELEQHLDVDRVLALRARLDDPDQPLAGKDLQTLWRVGLWSIWLELQRARPVL